jgi:hypothetical protein
MTHQEWAAYFGDVQRHLDQLAAQQPLNENVAQLATLANDRVRDLIRYLVRK